MKLYFNTKLTQSTLHENSLSTFYPVVFPKDYEFDKKFIQFEILKSVLISYSRLDFNLCIFNIELEFDWQKEELNSLINSYFKNQNFQLNFKRPYNKKTWIEDIQKHFSEHLDTPILLVMNHDHEFIEYSKNIFYDVINETFNDFESKNNKVLFYSHIPELISYALNKEYVQNRRYHQKKNLFYEIENLDYQIDSTVIMTSRTLLNILKNIKYEISYFGRIDWKNLYFKKLRIKGVFYPREFFRHFEGYSHISGLRLVEELSLEKKYTYNDKNILEFYYQSWLRFSIFILRDGLKNNNSKASFIKLIEKSLNIFKMSYLDKDLEYGIMNNIDTDYLKENLRNKIYYNANEIYSQLEIDNKLIGKGILKKLSKLYNTRIKYLWLLHALKQIIKK
ncbi:MAG: hypothetical protein VW298_02565 [Candidatus Woesearchaeota archaeon]